MKFAKLSLALICGLWLSACATTYQSHGWTGGYSDHQISPVVWNVVYSGNGYTTAETVQTFWLFHASEFTLAHGFAGFRILTPPGRPYSGSTTELPVDLGLVGKPYLSLTIELLPAPVTPRPPAVFDASALKAVLAPLVKGRLCDGNVCPHVHSYLVPAVVN